MTELSVNSAVGDLAGRPAGPGTRMWIGLVVTLGLAVIGLNAALFLLVRSHEQSIEARETAVQRRLVQVEEREARRAALDTEIHGLEQKRRAAQAEAEQAQRDAADALTQKTARDKLVNEINDANGRLVKLRNDASGITGQIANIRDEEAAARAALSQIQKQLGEADLAKKKFDADNEKLRTEQRSLSAQLNSDRDAAREAARLAADQQKKQEEWAAKLRDRSGELATVEANLRDAKAQLATVTANQVATQQAIRARGDAENELNKVRSDLQGVSRDLSSAQADLTRAQAEIGRLRDVQRALDVDKSAAQQAAKERAEVEAILTKQRGDLQGIMQEITNARSELARTQTEIGRLRDVQRALVIDQSAAQQAMRERAEAEGALSKIRGELEATRAAQVESQNVAGKLLQLRSNVESEEAALKRAVAARVEAEQMLARQRTDLSGVQTQLANGQPQLSQLLADISRLQPEVTRLQTIKASIDGDSAAAKAAQSTRLQEEEKLSRTKGEHDTLMRQIGEDQARRSMLLIEIDKLKATLSALPPATPAGPDPISGTAPAPVSAPAGPIDTPKN